MFYKEKRLTVERARCGKRVLFGSKPDIEISYRTFLEYRRESLTLEGSRRYQFMGFAINNYRLTKHFNCYVKMLRYGVFYMHRVGTIRSDLTFRYSFVNHCSPEELPCLNLY